MSCRPEGDSIFSFRSKLIGPTLIKTVFETNAFEQVSTERFPGHGFGGDGGERISKRLLCWIRVPAFHESEV